VTGGKNQIWWLDVAVTDWHFPVSPAGVEASNAACRQLADMVAEGGDEIEEMARERNRDDPAMWLVRCTATHLHTTPLMAVSPSLKIAIELKRARLSINYIIYIVTFCCSERPYSLAYFSCPL
jgi:hypothetical protein